MSLRRLFRAGVVMLLTTAAIAGCGSHIKIAESGVIKDKAGQQEEQLTLIHVDAGKKEFEAFIDQAEAELGISIQVISPPVNPDSRHAQISTMLASGDKSVDLFSVNDEMISEFKAAGYLSPLTAHVMTEELISQYPKNYVEDMLLFDGEIYSVPYMMDVMSFWVNDSYLREAGLESIETREDFITFLSYDWGEDRYAYAGAWDRSYVFNEIGGYINLFGGDYYNWDDPKTKEAVVFMKTMLDQGWTSSDALISQYDQINKKFLEGKVGMVFEYTGFMNDLVAGGYYGAEKIHLIPLPDLGEKKAYVASWQYVLNRSSEKKEAAYRFLNYAAGRDAGIQYADAMSRLPARRDLLMEEKLGITGFEEIKKYLDGLNLVARPMPNRSMNYISSVGTLFQQYLVGEKELESYCMEMQKLVEAVFLQPDGR